MVLTFLNRLFSKERIEARLILKGMQCPKRYWFERHDPMERVPDEEERLKEIMNAQVREQALRLFPGITAVSAGGAKGVRMTADAMKAASGVLANAHVEAEGVVVHSDVVVWNPEGVQIYQIKSSGGIKESYFTESALVWHIMEAAGIAVSRAHIIHLNNRYTLRGEVDPLKLLTVKSISQTVRKRMAGMAADVSRIRGLNGACPRIEIGPQCSDPYPCEYRKRCWRHIPSPSVFDLHKLPGKKKFELYRQGIVRFDQIPGDFPLRPEQTRQIRAELTGHATIDRSAIGNFLERWKYPLYFLDFETFQQAVPEFEGVRPYEQIPFQFSLHRLDGAGEEPVHSEFLAEAGADPRANLATALAAAIGPEGSIIAYNQSFEKSVIKRLGEQFPEFSAQFAGMLERFVDLMEPFEKGWYYTKEMGGRHSIKAVLPALVPELSYRDLAIGDGGLAMVRYALLHLETNPDRVEKTRSELLEYCRLDTYAMVKIWEKLCQSV